MYLAVDCEMGGLTLDKSLLQMALIVADKNFNVVDELCMDLQPDDGIFHVTAEALQINKINLSEWGSSTKYKDAKTTSYEFLCKHSNKGKDKLVVVGKNVLGDLHQIWHSKVVSKSQWENFCSYRLLDISSVWLFLELQGKVPVLENTGLSNIAYYLGINKKPDHTAREDALVSLEIMKGLMLCL